MIKSIQMLRKVEKQSPSLMKHYCQEMLLSLYSAELGKIKFQPDERNEIINEICKNIRQIDTAILLLGFSFEREEAPTFLKMRSGIQYLLDDFVDVPSLKEELMNLQRSDSIAEVDERLEDFKAETENFWNGFQFTEEELIRPKDVPSTHTWWF